MIKRVDVSSRLGSELPQQQENYEEGRLQGKSGRCFFAHFAETFTAVAQE